MQRGWTSVKPASIGSWTCPGPGGHHVARVVRAVGVVCPTDNTGGVRRFSRLKTYPLLSAHPSSVDKSSRPLIGRPFISWSRSRVPAATAPLASYFLSLSLSFAPSPLRITTASDLTISFHFLVPELGQTSRKSKPRKTNWLRGIISIIRNAITFMSSIEAIKFFFSSSFSTNITESN